MELCLYCPNTPSRRGAQLRIKEAQGTFYVISTLIIKLKVKLFLCLTKHHGMKTYWGVEV
jgi:hypothetical protein